MNTLTHASERLDYLDAVRAFALILGIVFHASLSFMPVFIGWAVMDISTSESVSVFVLISHAFRMPLFFLVAGYFGHLVFHKKGNYQFVRSRYVRLGIPLVLGWCLLRPMLVAGWIMGADSMRGDVDIAAALQASVSNVMQSPGEFLTGTHLWFLYYLLLVSTGVLVLRALLQLHAPVYRAVCELTDALVYWLSHSRLAGVVCILLIAGCLWFMSHWGIDTPDKSLIPQIPVLMLYGGFYLLGWALHRRPDAMTELSQTGWVGAVACVLAIVTVTGLSSFELQTGHVHYLLIKAGYLLAYAAMMWTLILLTLRVARYFVNKANPVVRYLSDASYWLYLFHLPVVIWLQIAFAELPLHWFLKLVSICVITLCAGLLCYAVFVRRTGLGALLNGKRYGGINHAA